MQVRQIEVQFLLLVGALVGEVAGGFRRTAKRGGAVVHDSVLALFLKLSSPIFLLAVILFARHGG